MPTPMQKLAKLALDHPELRPDLMPLIREAAKGPAKKEWSSKGRKRKEIKTKERQEGKKQIKEQLRQADKTITGPPTTEVFEKKIDHGYDEPLAGGTDVMKRLQDKFLIEQGREPREPNPRLAFCRAVQRGLVSRLQERTTRAAAEQAITQYMEDTGKTVLVKAAAEDIINYAVAVALDPKRIAHIMHKHTVRED